MHSAAPSNASHVSRNKVSDYLRKYISLRPKQDRTGVKWNGWPQSPLESSSNWWRQTKTCFEVDHICHTPGNDWFYYEPQSNRSTSFQPSMELKNAAWNYDKGMIANTRVNFTVNASSIVHGVYIDEHTFQQSSGTCKISSIPTHMTLHSNYNFMMGEFYVRTLAQLHLLMTSHKNLNANEIVPQEQDIQFYVHLSHGDQTLYDGHKLLLSGMLSREDAAEVKSILDLFDMASDGIGEQDVSNCECFEKMVFCGYDVFTDKIPSNKRTNNLIPDQNLTYTLWNAANTALKWNGYCSVDEIRTDLYSCNEWANLRTFLASNLMKRYPSTTNDILRFRRFKLLEKGFINKSYNGTTHEFIFVGLAQRSSRRSWINLPQVMELCNSLYTEKQINVICVEINVEKTINPHEQLVLHRGVSYIFLFFVKFSFFNAHILFNFFLAECLDWCAWCSDDPSVRTF